MFALLVQDFDTFENNEWVLNATTKNKSRRFVEKLVISIFENYQKTINDSFWNKFWLEIIQVELIALITNETWNIVVSFKNVNIVINKWIFLIKMRVDDTLNKLKIKFVTKDFLQIFEIDYTKTFASTIKIDTFRLFFVMIVLKDFECHQIDVNNIFTK